MKFKTIQIIKYSDLNLSSVLSVDDGNGYLIQNVIKIE